MAKHEEPAGAEGGGAGAEGPASTVGEALGRKGRSELLDAEVAAFLRDQRALAGDQRRLVKLQVEDLEEDRALRHRHIALDHRHLALTHFGQRLRVGLQLLAIGLGLVVAAGLAAMVWRAHEDHGLVVEAFSVPPDLAQRGLTGQVVAAQLLDKLAAMQAKTSSDRPARSYQNDWGEDLKVQIPETGVSIGEFNRYLRQWLGHPTRVSGEVFRTPAGVAVIARVGGSAGETARGAESDLDALLQQAGESVYRRTQPYRYAVFLEGQGRLSEAAALFTALADGPVGEDRIWGDVGLALLLLDRGDPYGALARAHDATRIGPGSAQAWEILGAVEDALGREEAVLSVARRAYALARRNPEGLPPTGMKIGIARYSAFAAEELGDFQGAVSLLEKASSLSPSYAAAFDTVSQIVRDRGLVHDGAGVAAAAAAAGRSNGGRQSLLASLVTADIALGRWSEATSTGAVLQARVAQGLDESVTATGLARAATARIAYAKAMAGDMAGAQALIAPTPLDCYVCLRMRGRIAAAQKDWPQADRWFAEAARQAPSLPFAWSDWGEMLLARGDLAGAIARFRVAHDKGPRFADALKGWGDALARQGQRPAALAKYDDALKLAPAWSELRQARDKAAKR